MRDGLRGRSTMSESEEQPDGAPSDSVADVGLIDEMLRMSPTERQAK
jgi:hypothetical protein